MDVFEGVHAEHGSRINRLTTLHHSSKSALDAESQARQNSEKSSTEVIRRIAGEVQRLRKDQDGLRKDLHAHQRDLDAALHQGEERHLSLINHVGRICLSLWDVKRQQRNFRSSLDAAKEDINAVQEAQALVGPQLLTLDQELQNAVKLSLSAALSRKVRALCAALIVQVCSFFRLEGHTLTLSR